MNVIMTKRTHSTNYTVTNIRKVNGIQCLTLNSIFVYPQRFKNTKLEFCLPRVFPEILSIEKKYLFILLHMRRV